MRFIELFQIPTVSSKAHDLRVIGSYPIRDLSLHLGRMLRDAAKQEKYTTTVDIIRQIALTGCRRGEMIALKWTEADTEARDIDDPSETYTENGAMAYAVTDDKVKLYYEETGSGVPVIFVHEFAGDHRSWEPQVRHFGKRYRAITFAARGFAPSDVPADASSYSQVRAADDIASVLDHLAIPAAHIVGLSMGGFATLHFGFRHPKRAKSLCVGGCGYGAEPDQQAKFKDEAAVVAAAIQAEGMNAFAERYAYGPTRVQFENKDPRGFLEFKQMLAGHNGLGSANTQRGVQRERPSLYTLIDEMKSMTVPTLILTGDEDWPCLLPGILMKQNIPSAALAVMPNSGHTINLEEPDEFNRILSSFITQVDCGRWPPRDPRAIKKSITGMKD